MSSDRIQKPIVRSPLGDDALKFKSIDGTEEIGRLFQYELTVLSQDPAIDFNKVLGQGVTVEVQHDDGAKRYLHGYVSRFTQSSDHDESNPAFQMYGYSATLVPWFWFLKHTADCRIFQDMTLKEIIEKVFGDMGFSDYKINFSRNDRYPYCTQYRETAFDFLSRLMERQGITYYFTHENGRHVMVLDDATGSNPRISGSGELEYYAERNPRSQKHLVGWSIHHEVRSGTYESMDFDFTDPSGETLSRKSIPQQHAQADGKVFDFPGNLFIPPHQGIAEVRIEELQSMRETVTARTGNLHMATGHTFKVSNHPRSDQRREYLIVKTHIAIAPDEPMDEGKSQPTRTAAGVELPAPKSAGGPSADEYAYCCHVTLVDLQTPFRTFSRTPKPVAGPHTAIVVGPDGEEIWTDEYGRVKVQFHWDRYGSSDADSSCFVRVSQGWAGDKWGELTIPRVGQEVIVEFLQGDPDQPIITGRVYNAEQKPPYELPQSATQSGIKTRSTPDGSEDNFNELRFEDKKDEEEIYLHAERNFTRIVENDDVLKVGFDKADPGDQTIEIYNNRTATITKGDDKLTLEEGDQTIDVKGAITVTAGDQITLKAGQSEIVMKKDGSITIKGGNIKINASQSLSATGTSGAELTTNASLKLEGMQTKVKGLQLDLAGDAMAKLKGGVTMIG